jgi:UPF0755 protein
MRKLVFGISVVVLLAMSALLIAWHQFTDLLAKPRVKSSPDGDRVVFIPENLGAADLVAILDKEGLIAHPDVLKVYTDVFAKPLPIHSGEYALSPAMSPIDLIKKISSGKVVTYTISVPPGAEALQIVELLAEKALGKKEELKRLVFDRRMAELLGVPNDSLEGYLFPDAYDLPRGLSPKDLLGALVARFRKVVTQDIVDRARARGLTEYELITLASLIEKSNVVASERRVFASLLLNRVKAHIPLESEASVDYGLHRAGVARDAAKKPQLAHPWNTQLNEGLPPTPIASPSLAAIMAASEPSPSKALYMVKRADGTHVFCEDEECYRATLKQWPQSDRVAPKRRAR